MADSDRSFRCFTANDLQRVREATFVRAVEHHAAIPSTNTRALVLAMDRRLELPALVLTDRQTAGRGRGVRRWWFADGALACSLIVECPDTLDVNGWPRVALTAGIAVCEALHQLCPGVDASVKWPNDVYVRGDKICGILVEVSPHGVNRMVVGIGVNVNNRLQEAPPLIRTRATTLADVAGYPFNLTSVLIAILNQLATHFRLLVQDPARLQQRWEMYCMLTGKTVEVAVGSRRTIGVCQGIDAQGALLVNTGAGVSVCASGEVTRWDR